MKEEQPKHRGIGQTMADLIAHIDWKLSILPESVKAWGLGEDALNELSGSLKRERAISLFASGHNAQGSYGHVFQGAIWHNRII